MRVSHALTRRDAHVIRELARNSQQVQRDQYGKAVKRAKINEIRYRRYRAVRLRSIMSGRFEEQHPPNRNRERRCTDAAALSDEHR